MDRHFLLHKSDTKMLNIVLRLSCVFFFFFTGHSCCGGYGLELVWSSCTLEGEEISHETWVTPKTLILLLDPGCF